MTMSGTARTSVADVKAYQEPNAPVHSAPSAAIGSKPASCQPQRQHREADEQRAQRDQPPARAHGDQAPVTIMAPIVSRVAPAGGSTNSPRLATRTRVASASTSSRSLL